MATIKKVQDTIYIVCPKCGYNNEKKEISTFRILSKMSSYYRSSNLFEKIIIFK